MTLRIKTIDGTLFLVDLEFRESSTVLQSAYELLHQDEEIYWKWSSDFCESVMKLCKDFHPFDQIINLPQNLMDKFVDRMVVVVGDRQQFQYAYLEIFHFLDMKKFYNACLQFLRMNPFLISLCGLNDDIIRDVINIIINPKHLPGTKIIKIRDVSNEGKFVQLILKYHPLSTADTSPHPQLLKDCLYPGEFALNIDVAYGIGILIQDMIKLRLEIMPDGDREWFNTIRDDDFSKELIQEAVMDKLVSEAISVYQFPDGSFELVPIHE